MIGRHADDVAAVLVGRARELDQLGQRRGGALLVADSAAEDQRHVGVHQKVGGRFDGFRRRRQRRRGLMTWQIHVWQRNRTIERFFLYAGIDRDIDRPLRPVFRDPGGTHDRIDDGLQRCRFVGPFGIGPYRLALRVGRMRPVDGTAIGRIRRPRPAENHDRLTVDPGVIEPHQRMLDPHQVMQDHEAPLAGVFRVAWAMCSAISSAPQRNHLRLVDSAVVDQRVVKPAETGAGVSMT